MRIYFADPEVVTFTEFRGSSKRNLLKLKIHNNLADPQVRKINTLMIR